MDEEKGDDWNYNQVKTRSSIQVYTPVINIGTHIWSKRNITQNVSITGTE